MKSPAFQLYAADFYMDTAEWTATEVGVYFRLLLHEWVNGSLPANNSALARIAGVDHRNMQKMWSVAIAKKFIMDSAGRYINERLEKTRLEQSKYIESQREKGRHRAAKMWEGHIAAATKRLQPEDSSSSSSSTSLTTTTTTKTKKREDIVTKLPFGRFVKLTQEEYDRLLSEWGIDKLTTGINKLDYSINTGKKYVDHNLTLRNWDRRGYFGGSNGDGRQHPKQADSAKFGDGRAYPVDLEVNE